MKKLSSIALLFFICFSLSAQYKKASFFGKEGRTYGIGTQLYAMGDGKGSPVGFAITFGRDRDGKQFFPPGTFNISLLTNFLLPPPILPTNL